MFQSLLSLFGATTSSGEQAKRYARKSPQRRCRRLCGESLERREVFSGTGFSVSAAGEAAIMNDAKALHLSNAQVNQIVAADMIAKFEYGNVSTAAVLNTTGISAAEKLELLVVNANLHYAGPAHTNASTPSLPSWTVSAAANMTPAEIDQAFQTPGELDAWLSSDSSDLYSTPDDLESM